MKNKAAIYSSVLLRDNQIILNGQTLTQTEGLGSLEFLDSTYEKYQMSYPKFFKMDNLCKTAFIAAEVMLRDITWVKSLQPEEIGIVVSTAHSSLDTDLRYENTIENGPSPALFVYTLPNIMVGELSIRHKFKGETACFVFDIFDPEFQTDYINGLFETGKLKLCLSGWADFFNGKAEAFFYLAGVIDKEDTPEHNSENIKKIYPAHE